MRARRVDYWRHTRAPIPLPCSGHRGPVVRAPRGLEEPIEPPEPESPGGLCAAPQPVPVLCLCSGCATGQGMSGACAAAREVSPTTTGIQTGHQHVFAIWMHTSILSGHLGSLSPSVPLALPLSPKFQAGSPSSGGLLVADTGPVRSSAAWRWAGGNRGSLPVDDDGSVGGRRRAVDGEESQDNTGRRDGPYVNEGARGAQQYRRPGDTTQGPGRAGLRFGVWDFFWSLAGLDWVTGTSRLDSYQDSRLLQGCGIVVWAGGRSLLGQVSLGLVPPHSESRLEEGGLPRKGRTKKDVEKGQLVTP